MRSRPSDSCRELLKNLMILPLQLQYIFSLLPFVVKYKLHSENDSVNTRQNSNFYQLVSNNLPSDIKKIVSQY
jgi:hypothetical protein